MSEPAPRRQWLIVAGILGVAFAFRLLFLRQIGGHALYSTLTADPAVYQAQALDILRGKLTADHAYFHSSPLYPYFVAAIVRLAGPGLQAVRNAQALVGCATVFLVYELARRTVGRIAAAVAGLLAALYVPLVFFEAEFLEITLVMALTAGSLLMVMRATEPGRRGLQSAISAGLLLGLAALGKPNLLLFVPVAAAWVLLRSGSRQGERNQSRRAGPARERAARAAALFMAAGVAILPATIHNYRSEGDIIPVSSNGGINLYIGNHPGAPGTFTVPSDMRFDLRIASKAVAENATGRTLSAGEVSDYWAERALGFMRERPAMWLTQTVRKFRLFWNHYEIPNHYDLGFVARDASALRFPVGTFAVVAPLGVVGLALAALRRRRVDVLILFGITFMCSVLPFFITSRYRLPIVLALLPGAGFAVQEVWRMARSASWKGLAALGVAVAAVAVPVNIDTIEFGTAQMHNTLGAIYGGQGDLEAAAAEFEAALEDDPGDLSARRNLGLAYLELGRHEDAAREFRAALRRHPRYYEAEVELGMAYAGMGSFDMAIETWSMLLAKGPPPRIASRARALISRYSEEKR